MQKQSYTLFLFLQGASRKLHINSQIDPVTRSPFDRLGYLMRQTPVFSFQASHVHVCPPLEARLILPSYQDRLFLITPFHMRTKRKTSFSIM